MDNQQGPIVEHMELYSMLCASLVGSGSSGKKRYMYVYDWVPLLVTWNYHNIFIWLYPNKK